MRYLIVCLALAGCFDRGAYKAPDDAGVDSASPDAEESGRVKGCLDQPGVAPAPGDQLPCDLVPPGVQL